MSPKTSPQDVAEKYPTEIERIDKFWQGWIGPGRRFPLPPLVSSERPQWLVDYWPENKPIDLPQVDDLPVIESKPAIGNDEKEPDDGYITLYRGVGERVDPGIIYDLANVGIAYPKGLLPGHKPHISEGDHSWGNTESIYTSWSKSKEVAKNFARGG